MRRSSLRFVSFLLVLGWMAPRAAAEMPARVASDASNGPPVRATDTITWWCTDISAVMHVDVPVIVGRGALVPPDPAPIPDVCHVAFPVSVPFGSAFASSAGWITNKAYPPLLRAALQATGYDFHSESPAEDFMSKLTEVRVEVRDFDDDGSGAPIATYRYDPQRVLRRIQVRAGTGARPLAPIIDPALGIEISPDEHGRLPEVAFPALAGPVSPGHYRLWTVFTLSEPHNDGLGLDDHFLPAGDSVVGFAPFFVLPQ